MKISTILRKAHELLKVGGWTKHIYVDGKGRHCMMGALDWVMVSGEATDYERGDEARTILHSVIREQYPRRGLRPRGLPDRNRIVAFNDAPSTKWADVDRVFEKAIVQAEESIDD